MLSATPAISPSPAALPPRSARPGAARWARALAAGGVMILLAVPLVTAHQSQSGSAAQGNPLAAAGGVGIEIQPPLLPGQVETGDLAIEPAQPFIANYGSEASARRAETCLTEAIYYEGALESESGQRAIAQVVLNRVRHPAYSDTVCGVVFQGQERSTGCQFTFTCDGARARPPVPNLWRRANLVAKAALGGAVAKEVGLSTHYHADYVKPYWSASLTPSGQIGRHVFYRWRGTTGQPAAFTMRYSGQEPLIAAYTPRTTDAWAAEPGAPQVTEREDALLAEAAGSILPPAPAPAPTPFRARPLPMAGKAADGSKK